MRPREQWTISERAADMNVLTLSWRTLICEPSTLSLLEKISRRLRIESSSACCTDLL